MAKEPAGIILMPGSATILYPNGSRNGTGDPSQVLSVFLMLGNELGAMLHTGNIADKTLQTWVEIRMHVVAPLLNAAVFICLILSVMILVEKCFFGLVCLVVRWFRLKPERRYKCDAIKPDLETGNMAYPMVLVQIPMYNEKEVYKKSIGAACRLDWPTKRLLIQVLDDSTDPSIKDLVQIEVEEWKNKGLNIYYEIRSDRKGYKAGALSVGMNHSYVKDCEFIAMFDADFQPEPDFLTRAIPYLVHNPEIALVQARWKFVNANECIMTRIQEMSLDYHFKIEQEAGSTLFGVFGFNGTAGIWRVQAIHEAGGWNARTTVEDMDLAIRACLQGWKFVYVGDIKVKSELPSSYKAYKSQQHRWSCGPANLVKKIGMEVIFNKRISATLKLYLVCSFFFIGKIVAHTETFIFYCFLIPVSVLIPEVSIPLWAVVYVACATTILKAFGTPSSAHLVVFWVLFENVMSFHRLKAAFSGLLEVGRVNEWVVTEKLGDTVRSKIQHESIARVEEDLASKLMDIGEVKIKIEEPKQLKRRFWHTLHWHELIVAFFLTICGIYDVLVANVGFYIYLFLQGIAFFIAGFGSVGN